MPTKTTSDDFDSRFGDLEDKPTTPPVPTQPKPEPTQTPKPEKPKTEPTPEPEQDPSDADMVVPSEGNLIRVRSWGQRMAKWGQKTRAKLSAAEAKIAELEKQQVAPKESPDVAALTAQLSEATKKLQDAEGFLRLTRYERSTEYNEKYKAPWAQAQTRAERDVKQMVVYEPNPEDPDLPPTERVATGGDFDEIYNLPLGKAVTLAHKKFGAAQAPLVMQHYSRLHELAEAAYTAIQDHKSKGEEFEKQQTARQATERQAMDQLWTKTHEALLKKHGKWFDQRDGDTAWNEALAKGREIADMKFTDAYEKLTPQQKVALDAQIYHRAAAFPAVKAWASAQIAKLESDLTAANKTIEELRGSGPGKPIPNADTPREAPKNSMEAFDKATF